MDGRSGGVSTLGRLVCEAGDCVSAAVAASTRGGGGDGPGRSPPGQAAVKRHHELVRHHRAVPEAGARGAARSAGPGSRGGRGSGGARSRGEGPPAAAAAPRTPGRPCPRRSQHGGRFEPVAGAAGAQQPEAQRGGRAQVHGLRGPGGRAARAPWLREVPRRLLNIVFNNGGSVRSKLRPPPLSHPTPAQRPEQRPLLNAAAAAPRPLPRPYAESRVRASSPYPSASPPLSPGESVTRRRLPPQTRAPPPFPAALPPPPPTLRPGQTRPSESEAPGHRAYPPSSFPTPLRRSTRPLPAPIPWVPETPEVERQRGRPLLAVPPPGGQRAQRDHRVRGGPKCAQGCHKRAFLITGSAVPHPGRASKDRGGRPEQGRGPVGKRRPAAGRVGRKDRWTRTDGRRAKVWARDTRLDGSQDLKGAQDLRRQPRGDEGTPEREPLLEFIYASSKLRTFCPPPGGALLTETGYQVCWGAARAKEGGR